MKKIFIMLLCLVLLSSGLSHTAFAEGDGNMDGGAASVRA